MKKLLGFASLLFIALLTACNADNLDEIVEAGKAVQVTDDSDVPVLLSISPAQTTTTEVTRAPLATQNGNFSTPDGQYLGVFALAQTNTPAGGQSGPVATSDIKWDGTVANARPLWNQPMTATYANNSTTLQFIDPATLSSTPTATSCYYPLNSWYNYYFYTYYPRVDDNKIHVSSNNVVTADYTLDGSQDIITAKAIPASNPNSGYCAKYVRENPNNKPQLALEHQLAQLRFYVHTASNATSIRVTDIRLLNVPTEWALTIADKLDTGKTGTLTSRNTTKTDILVRTMVVANDNTMTSADNTLVFDGTSSKTLTKKLVIAGYAMVPTTEMLQNANFSTSYEVSITYEYNGEVFTRTSTLTPSNDFVKATVYNINITVNPAGSEITDERIVDLGLSVYWASMNVGAGSETDFGEGGKEMIAWAATEGHGRGSSTNIRDGYLSTWENTPYYSGYQGGKYYWDKYSKGGSELDTTDDIAAQHGDWGDKWRMPTSAEYSELISNTTHTWQTNYNGSGVNGMLFTSTKTGYTTRSIFLPASGYRYNVNTTTDRLFQKNNQGYYWSKTLSGSNQKAVMLSFTNEGSVSSQNEMERRNGLLVRAVYPKN